MTQQVNLTEALKKYFGFDTFKGDQEKIIQNVLDGKDTFVLMPTGGGKSLCYQLPSLLMEGTAIVISPLIALMKNQVDVISNLSEQSGTAHYLNSSLNKAAIDQVKEDILAGHTKLLYVAPESLTKEDNVEFLKSVKISFYAIDEAHCISHWGHDFRPEYSQLGILRDEFPDTPVMALTATADKLTRNDIINQLHLRVDDEEGIFISSFDRPNLSLRVMHGYEKRDKDAYIINYIRQHPHAPGIVYCLSRKSTEQLAQKLRKAGIQSASYHAGMTSGDRDNVQEAFSHDDIQVVCATIAFGMGIDKSNIRWVIHYNMPKSIEGFYQEIGRAGRDGLHADTILFYSLQDIVQLSQFIQAATDVEVRRTNSEKLRLMRQYAEARICRRRILLNYFNEPYDKNCNNCDVCNHPPQTFDGTIVAQKALSAAARTQESRSSSTLIDILRGKVTETIRRNGYDHLPTFGKGAEYDERQWRDFFLQLLQMGYIEIAYDKFNAVKITPFGWEVIRGKRRVDMVDNTREKQLGPAKRNRQLRLTIPVLGGGKSIDPALYEELRLLRKRIADEKGVPAFVIMNDKVLSAIATHKPQNETEFGMIPGIGAYKREQYAEAFIAVIKKHP